VNKFKNISKKKRERVFVKKGKKVCACMGVSVNEREPKIVYVFVI